MSSGHCTSSYAKVSRSAGGASCRGFRLRCSRKFSVQAFRVRFLFLFRIVSKWKYTYCRALKSFLKRGVYGGRAGDGGMGKMSQFGRSRSTRELTPRRRRSHECGTRSFGRSNSFYSEAIADCLEFIKRTSVSDIEEDEKPPDPTVDDGFQINLSSSGLCREEKQHGFLRIESSLDSKRCV